MVKYFESDYADRLIEWYISKVQTAPGNKVGRNICCDFPEEKKNAAKTLVSLMLIIFVKMLVRAFQISQSECSISCRNIKSRWNANLRK